jgi:hypothetical protein
MQLVLCAEGLTTFRLQAHEVMLCVDAHEVMFCLDAHDVLLSLEAHAAMLSFDCRTDVSETTKQEHPLQRAVLCYGDYTSDTTPESGHSIVVSHSIAHGVVIP